MLGDSISTVARRQSIVEQQQGQRSTRQMDLKKRHTNNSRDDKCLVFLNETTIKKKQKLVSNSNTLERPKLENEILHYNANKETVESDSIDYLPICNVSSELVINPKMLTSSKTLDHFSSSSDDDAESIDLDKENSALSFGKNSSLTKVTLKEQNQTLGIGHLSVLHAFVRDQLFKKIKILSNNHLETTGAIMKACFKKLQFTERINGNIIAFSNACRTEIRKTMCSRRGYVKRQIGILLAGKF